MTKPKNAFEVARDAKIALQRGISSKDELCDALARLEDCKDKIDRLAQNITELALLESQLSKMASDFALAHPDAMDRPLSPVKDGIRQGIVKFGGRVYTLTETRNDTTTRLWSVRKAQQGDGSRVS